MRVCVDSDSAGVIKRVCVRGAVLGDVCEKCKIKKSASNFYYRSSGKVQKGEKIKKNTRKWKGLINNNGPKFEKDPSSVVLPPVCLIVRGFSRRSGSAFPNSFRSSAGGPSN